MAYIAELGGQSHRIALNGNGSALRVEIDGQEREVNVCEIGDGTYSLLIDGRSFTLDVSADGELYTVSAGGQRYIIRVRDERQLAQAGRGGAEVQTGHSEIRAMMPGKVVDLLVEVGATVSPNQGLLIIEAMKMENEIRSPIAGTVTKIGVSKGQTVKTGDLLIVLE